MDWSERRERVNNLADSDLIPNAMISLERRVKLNGGLTKGVLIKGDRYSRVVFNLFSKEAYFMENDFRVRKAGKNEGIAEEEWYVVDVDAYLKIYLKKSKEEV